MLTNNELNEARRVKALATVYNFSGKIMTLGDYINSKTIVRKSTFVREYENHKRDMYYHKLAAPKTEYTLWYIDNGRELGIDVPKLVYESFEVTTPP